MSDTRTVTTVEELNALPFQSVIRDAQGIVREKWGSGGERKAWFTVGSPNGIGPSTVVLPAAVLDEPEVTR